MYSDYCNLFVDKGFKGICVIENDEISVSKEFPITIDEARYIRDQLKERDNHLTRGGVRINRLTYDCCGLYHNSFFSGQVLAGDTIVSNCYCINNSDKNIIIFTFLISKDLKIKNEEDLIKLVSEFVELINNHK